MKYDIRFKPKAFRDIESLPSRIQEALLGRNAELRSLWAQSNPDEKNIVAKQKEGNDLRARLQEMSVKHRLQARGVLTPEQQTQVQGYLSDTGNFGPGYGKRGGGRGMGMGPESPITALSLFLSTLPN